jgi:hypothetical protein
VTKQAEAAKHIKDLLGQRSVTVPSRTIILEDNQRWIIFEYQGRQVGIDSVSGVWIRVNERADWRCISMPCSVSGALQAVEFLTKE